MSIWDDTNVKGALALLEHRGLTKDSVTPAEFWEGIGRLRADLVAQMSGLTAAFFACQPQTWTSDMFGRLRRVENIDAVLSNLFGLTSADASIRERTENRLLNALLNGGAMSASFRRLKGSPDADGQQGRIRVTFDP